MAASDSDNESNEGSEDDLLGEFSAHSSEDCFTRAAHCGIATCDMFDAACCDAGTPTTKAAAAARPRRSCLAKFVRFFGSEYSCVPLWVRVLLFAACIGLTPLLSVQLVRMSARHLRNLGSPKALGWNNQGTSNNVVQAGSMLQDPSQPSSMGDSLHDASLMGIASSSSAVASNSGQCRQAREEWRAIEGDDLSVTSPLTYLYLAGVEGSGHHGFMSLLLPPEPKASSSSSSSTAASPPLPPLLKQQVLSLAEARAVHEASHALWRNDDAALLLERRASLTTALAVAATSAARDVLSGAAGPRWLVGPLASDGQPLSYPFGEARVATSRPALSELRAACAQAKVLLRVVVLWRDPLACTLSRLKAMPSLLTGHALLQARLVDTELQRLSFETSSMPCGSLAVASYEALLEDPTTVARQLAIFAGLEPEPLASRARAAIKPPPATITVSTSSASRSSASAPTVSVQQIEGLKAYFGYSSSSSKANAPVSVISSTSSTSASDDSTSSGKDGVDHNVAATGVATTSSSLVNTTAKIRGWGSLLAQAVSLAQVSADVALASPGSGSQRGASDRVCCAVGPQMEELELNSRKRQLVEENTTRNAAARWRGASVLLGRTKDSLHMGPG